MENTDKKAQHMLQELSELDQKLEKIQIFFRNSKSNDINDSLLTEENIQEAISLLKKINPSEKHMINALKSLIPLSKNQTKNPPKHTLPPSINYTSNLAENYNRLTPKLKGKVPMNHVI